MLINGDKKLTSKKSGVVAQLLHDSIGSIESRMIKRYDDSNTEGRKGTNKNVLIVFLDITYIYTLFAQL